MKLSYEDHDHLSVLTLSGELTADQSDAFRRVCLERIESGVRNIVLDLQHLTLIDSVGLELLLWLVDQTGEHHGQLRLVQPDELVQKILQLTRLDRRFTVQESVEAAAKSLR